MRILLLLFILFIVNSGFSQSGDFQRVYIVVADSSMNYEKLRCKMQSLADKNKLAIDSMGRSYNPITKTIELPLDSDDQLYAGAYFPRRYVTDKSKDDSDFVSIEHMGFYNEGESEIMAVFAGMFYTKKEAKKRLKLIQSDFENAFIISPKIYMGCMH